MDSVNWRQKTPYIYLAFNKLALTFQGEGKAKPLSHGRQLLGRPRFTLCPRSFPCNAGKAKYFGLRYPPYIHPKITISWRRPAGVINQDYWKLRPLSPGSCRTFLDKRIGNVKFSTTTGSFLRLTSAAHVFWLTGSRRALWTWDKRSFPCRCLSALGYSTPSQCFV